jgi:hypothetical protein
MKKIFNLLFIGIVLTNICRAGTVNLYQVSSSGVQSQSDMVICGSQTHSFFIAYTFSSHSSCWANRYRVTFKLYKDGVEINSANFTVASTFANQGFYSFTVAPGTYSATVKLERRPCAGAWYTAETLNTNNINITSTATPNFSIRGTAASSSTVPLINFSNGEIITLDASGTTCASKYWVGVWETGINWWERTYAYEWGQWFSGQAPSSINLQQLATTPINFYHFNGDIARKGQILFGGTISSVLPAPGSTVLLPYQPGLIGQPRRYTVEVCTSEPVWICKKIQIVIN